MGFDEEDGDFLGGGVGALLDVAVPLSKQREGSSVSRGTYRDDGERALVALYLSSINITDDIVGTVEDIWDYRDKMATERFNDISAGVFWMPNRKRRSSVLLRMARVPSGRAGKGGSIYIIL